LWFCGRAAAGRRKSRMKDKQKHSASQLLNFAQDSYLERTSRPLYAVLFLMPFIIFYELGTIFIRTDVLNQSPVLVDSFVWLQKMLGQLGFTGKMTLAAPPFVVVTILLALQLASGKKWTFWPGDIIPMAIECILLAIPLIVLTLLLNSSVPPRGNTSIFDDSQTQVRVARATVEPPAFEASALSATNENTPRGDLPLLVRIVTGIGAGIYEELIFRLILIIFLMMVFQDLLRFNHTGSIILSVLISAALFSAHHNVDFLSGQVNERDLFNWTVFTFRTIAGVYFAALFAVRGFGITAGTHAFYDILAVLLNNFYFKQ